MCFKPRTSAIISTMLNIVILLFLCGGLYMTGGGGDYLLRVLLPHLWAWTIYATVSLFANIYGLHAIVKRLVKSMGNFCYYSIADLIYYFSVSTATCVYLLTNLPSQLMAYCESVNEMLVGPNSLADTKKCLGLRGQIMALGYTALCMTGIYLLVKLTFMWSCRRYWLCERRTSEETEKSEPVA